MTVASMVVLDDDGPVVDMRYWDGVSVICSVHGEFRIFEDQNSCPFCGRGLSRRLKRGRFPQGCIFVDTEVERQEG